MRNNKKAVGKGYINIVEINGRQRLAEVLGFSGKGEEITDD